MGASCKVRMTGYEKGNAERACKRAAPEVRLMTAKVKSAFHSETGRPSWCQCG